MKTRSLGTIRKADDGALTFCATSLTVDRAGEVVVPKGCEKTLDTYKQNPVLLYGHMSSPIWDGQKESLPIGKAVNLRFSADDNELLYDAEFSKANDFGQVVRGLVEEGVLNATSIGFRPKTMSVEDPLPGQKGVTHLEWDLMENSICTIPCNQDAVRRSISKSSIVSRFEKLLLVPSIKLDDGVYRGITDIGGSDGHQHSFLVEVRDGQIILGATSFENEHFHQVLNSSKTDAANDHEHTVTLEPMVNPPTDIILNNLGIPHEILNWTKEDIETAKHFLKLKEELTETPKSKQKDTDLEELAASLRDVSTMLDFNPAEVIKELIPEAFDAAILASVRGS